jgi:two-component system, OmpR family, phosphate regulon sensor histidine kinase PhoR
MKRNTTTFVLMTTSIILLLILQVFWLKSAYNDADDNFRKETNLLFRNTIFAMHDSLIERSIEPMYFGDSLKRFTLKRSPEPGKKSDTLINYFNMKERTARIEIISTNERDSVGKILRPLISKLQMEGEPKNFIIRLNGDSLRKDSIKFYFTKALENAGISAPFKVVTYTETPPTGIFRKRIHGLPRPTNGVYQSEIVRLNPINQYAVLFAGVNSLLIKEITPQIFFSLFLTTITVIAFFVMYKNLRAQQKLMQIKNDFISNVTHELKTPVATVSVALEALKNFNALDDPKRTSEYLDIAQNELNRLTLMTDKILKTSVFEDKGVELKIELVDLDAIISQVLASMKLVFEKRNTVLNYSKTGTSFTLGGSREHLTNILYNLVDNGLKYSPENSVLDIRLTNDKDKMTLLVRDEGIGISREYQKKIFEKFFRVPSGDVHNIKGYGLGLSYVSSVVKSHGGEIFLESDPGKGSTFTIVLPTNH